ncbi:MAG: phage tail termination protein [Aeromonadaceae bacterium]
MTKFDLPEYQVKEKLNSLGLLTGYTVQLSEYVEPATASDKVVLIKVDGSVQPMTYDYQTPTMFVAVFGEVNGPLTNHRLVAENIRKALITESLYNDVCGAQSVTNVIGPYRTDTGRPVFEVNFTLVFGD